MKRALFMLALTASFVSAESLQDVLRRMDQSAKTFRSLSADVHKTDYTAVYEQATEEDGTFKMMKRAKTAILLVEFSGRDERKVRIAGNKVELYHPKGNSVDEYDARKFTKSIDELLLVGFGVSSADLQKDFNISAGGSETIEGRKTTRLDMTPKSAERKKVVNMIQLWIPEDQGNPIREKRLSGKENKDYNIFQFSNMKINPSLPDSDFELNLPPGVKRIKAGN